MSGKPLAAGVFRTQKNQRLARRHSLRTGSKSEELVEENGLEDEEDGAGRPLRVHAWERKLCG